jgi:hydroxymethylbilane synthase
MPGQAQLLWLFERERQGDMASAVRIGTRGSPLARWQAEWVAGQLRRHHPDRDVALVEIKTEGDRDQNSPLATNGGIGVFTKEIQRELLEGTIDLAVHSLKDLPTQAPTGLALAVVPPREEPGDALIAPTSRTLEALPEGARVGTGSLRRRAQLLHLRPDLEVVAVRGNVETRLDRVLQGRLDAVVLAEAGLRRLGLDRHVTQRLAPPAVLPAVAQGALGLECRADDAPAPAPIPPIPPASAVFRIRLPNDRHEKRSRIKISRFNGARHDTVRIEEAVNHQLSVPRCDVARHAEPVPTGESLDLKSCERGPCG